MRLADVLGLALSALYQQKVRTALTALGVVIGSFVLAVSLSVGQGAQEAAVRQFRKYDQLRKVEVWTPWTARESEVPAEKLRVPGAMSEDKRQRLRKAILRRWNWENPKGPRPALTRERLRELEDVEHVTAVVPSVDLTGWVFLGDRSREVSGAAVAPEARSARDRIVAGRPFASASERTVLLSEYLLYQWGIVDDADVARVPGRPLRLEVRPLRRKSALLLLLFGGANAPWPKMTADEEKVVEKAVRQLPLALGMLDLTPAERESLGKLMKSAAVRPEPDEGAPVVEEFTVAGVLRDYTEDEERNLWERLNRDADVVLPLQTGEELFQRVPANAEQGYRQATVKVDSEEHVKEVVKRIKEMGLETFSLAEAIEQLRFTVLLITLALALMAGVALLVSALGITNTLLMSVLERTHEIGVMKAVGARDGHVQALFLVEGALLGAVGGVLGLLLAWLVSFPGDAVARSLVQKQVEIPLEESLFAFPLWLTLGVPLFACVVTTLAAVYPARRAAKVNPITALRHE